MWRLVIAFCCLLPVAAFAQGLVGVAYVNKLIGLNLEWTTEHNSFYVIPGVYFNQSSSGAGNKVRWVGGFRHRMSGETMDTSGFFIGVIGGDLGGNSHYKRLGIGGEMGVQLVKKYTRWTVSGAIVALNHDKKRNLDNEPAAILSLSLSLL